MVTVASNDYERILVKRDGLMYQPPVFNILQRSNKFMRRNGKIKTGEVDNIKQLTQGTVLMLISSPVLALWPCACIFRVICNCSLFGALYDILEKLGFMTSFLQNSYKIAQNCSLNSRSLDKMIRTFWSPQRIYVEQRWSQDPQIWNTWLGMRGEIPFRW